MRTSLRDDEARMGEAVQVGGLLVELKELLVLEVLLVGRVVGEDHLDEGAEQ